MITRTASATASFGQEKREVFFFFFWTLDLVLEVIHRREAAGQPRGPPLLPPGILQILAKRGGEFGKIREIAERAEAVDDFFELSSLKRKKRQKISRMKMNAACYTGFTSTHECMIGIL